MATEKQLKVVQRWRFMVEILCPHCDEEIELEDDNSGEFACPHCNGEFEWNVQPDIEQFDEQDSLLLTFVSGFFSGSLLLTGLALLVASVAGFSFSSVLWGAAGYWSRGVDLHCWCWLFALPRGWVLGVEYSPVWYSTCSAKIVKGFGQQCRGKEYPL